MAEFPELIEAQLNSATVRLAPLVKFEFASGTMRLWSGFGDLEIGNDSPPEVYKGIGNLGQISSLTQGSAGAVEEMTFTLFGNQGLLDNIVADAAESSGRNVTVYLQFFDVRKFDDDGNYVDWNTLDDPLVFFQGIMGPLTVTRRPPSDDARATRTVSVTAESFFEKRARPAFAFFSDLDQRARSPTDQIFSRVSHYANATVQWPRF